MDNRVESYDELLLIPSEKRTYYFGGNWRHDYQWKLHISLNKKENQYPALDDPLVRGISRHLIERQHHHKYANGGDGFTTYTIYTGAMEDNLALAAELRDKFELPRNKFEQSDLFLSNAISTRFSAHSHSPMFMHYGLHGTPAVKKGLRFVGAVADKLSDMERYLLHSMVGHIFAAKKYGENYLGKHYEKTRWDEGLFTPLADKLSLDEIQSYTQVALNSLSKVPLNPNLKTDKSVTLDIQKLTHADNESDKTLYKRNLVNVINKIECKPGFILDRYNDAIRDEHKSKTFQKIFQKFELK